MTQAASRRDGERLRLLEATLAHVPFDGWTTAAMRSGAQDAGLPDADVERLFPRGPDEMIALFVAQADRGMAEELARLDLSAMRIRDRIATAVRVRLTGNAAHREAVRKAVALQALPRNGPGGLRALYRTVDAIWYAAGDRSTDFSFYTRRLLLGAVYASTLLFWLDDDTEDFKATWAFLDRRIGNVMGIGKLTGRIRRIVPRPTRFVRRTVGLGCRMRNAIRGRSSETAS